MPDITLDISTQTITLNTTNETIALDTGGTGPTGPTGPAGVVDDGDYGDITVTSSGATWTIDSGVVTYAKMQDVSATSRVLGRITSGSGDVEELTGTNVRTIAGLATSDSPQFATLLAGDGTDTAPAYAFSADTDTGFYRSANNTVVFAANGAGRLRFGATTFSPVTNDGASLGNLSSGLYWSDLFLATGAVVNFNNGDYTLTHSTGTLAASGPLLGPSGSASAPTFSFNGDADLGMYRISADILGFATGGTGRVGVNATNFAPVSNDGNALGAANFGWSDLFLASGATINVANGDAVITHSSGIWTVSTGDLRVTTAGTNAASAVTVGGTQTLTNKTLTAPVISTISNTGTLTLPTSTDTLVGRATTDTLTNKTLTSPTLTTPVLGTPSSGTLTNCTGLPAAGVVNGTQYQALVAGASNPAWASASVTLAKSSGTPTAHTGDTNETILATITLPAMGANDMIELWHAGTYSGTNTKTLRIRIGGIGGTITLSQAVTTTISWIDHRHFVCNNSTSSQLYWPGASADTLSAASAHTTNTLDLSSAGQTIVITGQLTNSSESIGMQWWLAKIVRG